MNCGWGLISTLHAGMPLSFIHTGTVPTPAAGSRATTGGRSRKTARRQQVRPSRRVRAAYPRRPDVTTAIEDGRALLAATGRGIVSGAVPFLVAVAFIGGSPVGGDGPGFRLTPRR